MSKFKKHPKILIDDGTGPNGNPREVTVYEDHPLPVTRRDFIRMGLLGPTASFLIPSSLIGLIASGRHAEAAACTATINSDIWLVELNVGGGATFAQNVVSTRPLSRRKLPTESISTLITDHMLTDPIYSNHGRRLADPIRTDVIGNQQPFWDGSFVAGFTQAASAAARSKVAFSSFIDNGFLDSDNPGNPLSFANAVATVDGTTHFGSLANQSGVRKPTFPDAVKVGMTVGLNGNSLASMFSVGPSATNREVFDAIKKLEEANRAKRAGKFNGTMVSDQIVCTSENVGSYIANANRFNPNSSASNQAYAQAFQLANPAMAQIKQFAAVCGVVLGEGLGKTVSMQRGGGDYHNNTSTTGAQVELEIGFVAGAFIELAHLMGKKLMFRVFTDGGSRATGPISTGGVWTVDVSASHADMSFYYDPAGCPDVTLPHHGGFLTAFNASSPYNGSPRLIAAAALNNFLVFRGGPNNNINLYRRPDGRTFADSCAFGAG